MPQDSHSKPIALTLQHTGRAVPPRGCATSLPHTAVARNALKWPPAADAFRLTRLGRERPAGGRSPQTYFWMQVSTVSLVHSSRPVKTGSSTVLPSIRSIITDGAL